MTLKISLVDNDYVICAKTDLPANGSYDKFAKFLKRAEGFKVPILAGVIPLRSAGMARFMTKNVAGISVPEDLIKKMAEAEDRTQTGIQIAADLIKEFKDMCQGVHIMAIGWEKMVPEILDASGL